MSALARRHCVDDTSAVLCCHVSATYESRAAEGLLNTRRAQNSSTLQARPILLTFC